MRACDGKSEPGLSRIAWFRGQSGRYRFSGRAGFSGQLAQCLRGVLQETVADGLFAIDEPPDSALIYPEAPRKSCGAAKQLNTVGEVILSIFHCGTIACLANEAMRTARTAEKMTTSTPIEMDGKSSIVGGNKPGDENRAAFALRCQNGDLNRVCGRDDEHL